MKMPLSECLAARVVALIVGASTFGGLGAGCGEADGPGRSPERSLSADELAKVEILDGGASRWLPSHFSVTLHNGSELTITAVELEIDGRPFRRSARIEPGEQGTLRLQYLFPEDEGYGAEERGEVEWRLSGASGAEAR